MADLKLDTLIKVLLMTTSDNNSEALAAMRRANHLLKIANVDWEKLLKSKVTVVADPFADIAPPTTTNSYARPTVPPRPQHSDPEDYPSRPAPASYTKQQATSPPPRAPSYSPQAARRNNTNNFPGQCFNCDITVRAGYGALRDVRSKTHVFCEDCNYALSSGHLSISTVLNNNATIQRKKNQAATSYPPRVKRKVTTKDLIADIFDIPPDDVPF
jgi:hypothetical protein